MSRLKNNPEIVLGAVVLMLTGIIIGVLLFTGVLTGGNGETTGTDKSSVLININTADEKELAKLDGIAEGLAGRIVEYREENGNFSSVEEIKEVRGIGDAIFKKIQNYIIVE